MKSNFNDKLTIQQRLILPIILLGVVALIPMRKTLLKIIWLGKRSLVKYVI